RLQRWIDMPSRGWYSGDGHVHYARPSAGANRDLMVWTRAEDVHVANVMRMGDALKTYFEQYAYGKAGRHVEGDYALVPGQEDPRTIGMGHTLHMNLLSPFRIGEQYYLYDVVFDETRRQGGLTGYAHAYQPPAMGFFVRQDMSLNVAGGRVDFAEISEFGDIDTKLYYEFLNLGFPLTASAGSDVPWGHSIGTSRVYAYTGGAFHVDEWFRAVKNGHTFVTTGPMLELTVNGRIPGSRITARPGETLRVEARALGGPVPPRYLEIVVQGDVARSVSGARRELSLEWTAPVSGSTWIAARAAGAATSPVYVEVGGRRTWKLSQVEELIENRMQQLLDIETLIRNGTPAGRDGTWNNPEALKKQGPLLARRVAAAREIYEKLRLEARQQRALSN
ncbi:MAG: CehA/McbA family metallohydrolase, partial [Bryobacteraceae bacterium]